MSTDPMYIHKMWQYAQKKDGGMAFPGLSDTCGKSVDVFDDENNEVEAHGHFDIISDGAVQACVNRFEKPIYFISRVNFYSQ